MKSWMWSVLVGVVTLMILILYDIFFDIKFWVFLLVFLPLLITLFTMGSFTYSFRKSLQIKQVPKSGYDKRIKDLNVDARVLENIGFDKVDEFYLKMIPDIVTYVFKHQDDSVYFCLYHFGTKKICDISSWYHNDYTLTTCKIIEGGTTPRRAKSLLQIITKVSYKELLEIHRKAHMFLLGRGLKNFDIPKQEFRQYFLKSIHDQTEYVRKYPFWPVLLIFWTMIRRGRVYCKEIETQYKEGSIELSGV